MSNEHCIPSNEGTNATTDSIQAFLSSIRNISNESELEEPTLFGLLDFYSVMADPTSEYLEAVSKGFANLNEGQIDRIETVSTYAINQLERKLQNTSDSGLNIDRIIAGISNTLEVIYSRYYGDTGLIHRLSQSDKVHTILAEYLFEKIQLNNDRRSLRQFVQLIRDEEDLNIRNDLVIQLKEKIEEFIRVHSIQFTDNNENPIEQISLDLNQILEPYTIKKVLLDGNVDYDKGDLRDAIFYAKAAFNRYEFEQVLNTLPVKDHDRFNTLRLQFGAKAANLIILSESVAQINELFPSFHEPKVVIPDFQTVPVDVYNAWFNGTLNEEQLKLYYEWARSLRNHSSRKQDSPASIIVRSSAVYSEDDEKITGAGIYQSIIVSPNSSYEEFKRAVFSVFESVNTPEAQAYRALNGIVQEQMGLIIQKYIEPDYTSHSTSGYVNSMFPGVPQLMEIITKSSRNFIDNGNLDFFLPHDTHTISKYGDVHHFPPDTTKVSPEVIVRVAKVIKVLEKIFGSSIQVEYVVTGLRVNVVQVRKLPVDTEFQAAKISFPDKPTIFTGSSFGFYDDDLTVLDNTQDNSQKTGVVIFKGNDKGSLYNLNSFPKAGVVIIYDDNAANGHFQTVCAERGLVCVYQNKSDHMSALPFSQLSQMRSIRVVSNGFEGRVYLPVN